MNTPYDTQAAHDHVKAVMDHNDRLAVIEAGAAYVSAYPKPDIDAVNFIWFAT